MGWKCVTLARQWAKTGAATDLLQFYVFGV
jgi:hypothetical protein